MSRLLPFILALVCFLIAYDVATSEVPYYLGESKSGISRPIMLAARGLHEMFGKFGASLFYGGVGLALLGW